MANLIKKKKVKKNLELLIDNNVEGSKVVQYFMTSYEGIISPEEKQTLEQLDKHLLNLNVILNDMIESMK